MWWHTAVFPALRQKQEEIWFMVVLGYVSFFKNACMGIRLACAFHMHAVPTKKPEETVVSLHMGTGT